MSRHATIGIDIGTTSVKVVVIDQNTRDLLGAWSLNTDASVPSADPGINASEQDPVRILCTLQKCVLKVPLELRACVRSVGVSGQMHGVVLWKSGAGWKENEKCQWSVGSHVSRLYTWQDGRCTPDFLASLPKPYSHLRLASGFGCATLFWLCRYELESLAGYDCAGTIQDYVVAMLCNLDKPIMSTHNAASWGYFDTKENAWNTKLLYDADFPVHLLPTVTQPGSVVGSMSCKWCAIPDNAVVEVAMGDLQCSIFSKLHMSPDSAVINISTSAQVCFVLPYNIKQLLIVNEDTRSGSDTVEYFPYFNGQYLAVAASLNGGNVLAAFVNTLQQWTTSLGCDVSGEHIWNSLSTTPESFPGTALPVITPTIFGERHAPDARGTVTNVTPFNVSPHSIYRALCKGIARNLLTMMPPERLAEAGVTRILGSGGALVRNKFLQEDLQDLYKLPVEVVECGGHDAALGAALVVGSCQMYMNVE